jgi:DNA repair protein RadC
LPGTLPVRAWSRLLHFAKEPTVATFQLQDRQLAYSQHSTFYSPVELSILRRAGELLSRSMQRVPLKEHAVVTDYLRCKLAGLGFEVFGVLWLDSQLNLIADEILFRGSICSTTVHPRELVQHALMHNARGVILFHNHPSPSAEASPADKLLTDKVSEALALIDVRVYDHVIVAGDGSSMSFAARGLL